MRTRNGVLLLIFLLAVVMVSAACITVYPMAIHVDVEYENGSVVEGADVVVSCDGVDFEGTSDFDGKFIAGFDSSECDYVVEGDYGNYYGVVRESCGGVLEAVFVNSDVDSCGVEDRVIVGRISCDVGLVLVEVEEPGEPVVFSGVVYMDGVGVDGASVSVVCGGVIEDGVSDEDGNYVVEILDSRCGEGDVFSVYAESGDADGVSGELNVSDGTNGIDVEIFVPVEPLRTVFSGVVYNSTLYTEVVENASVIVICNGVSEDVISDVNGSYSVEFLESVCGVEDSFDVYGEKDGWFEDIDGLNVSDGTVVDLVLSEEGVFGEVGVSGAVYVGSVGIEGASVVVSCNGFVLNDVSDSVGGYDVVYSERECRVNFTVSVDASKTGYYDGSSSGVVGEDVDVVIKKRSSGGGGSSSGGSSGGGWAGCSEGYHVEHVNGTRCVLDVVLPENISFEDLGVSEADFESLSEVEKRSLLERFLAAITGAVIGGGVGSWIAAVVFALVVLGLFLFVRKRVVG